MKKFPLMQLWYCYGFEMANEHMCVAKEKSPFVLLEVILPSSKLGIEPWTPVCHGVRQPGWVAPGWATQESLKENQFKRLIAVNTTGDPPEIKIRTSRLKYQLLNLMGDV